MFILTLVKSFGPIYSSMNQLLDSKFTNSRKKFDKKNSANIEQRMMK
jgi:hypothetical protein